MAYNRSKFPDEYDVFQEKYDIPYSEIANVKRYQELYAKGNNKTDDETEEFSELQERLSEYLLTPEDINYYQDAMTNVQKFFVENTSGYIDELKLDANEYMDEVKSDTNKYVDNVKLDIDEYTDNAKLEIQNHSDDISHDFKQYVDDTSSELKEYADSTKKDIDIYSENTENKLNQFSFQGVYQHERQYKKFNIVNFRGSIYFAKKDTIRKDPTNKEYWLQIAENGASAEWRGTWSQISHYNIMDMVRYGNAIYICEVANHNEVPRANPEYWSLMVDNEDAVSGHYSGYYSSRAEIYIDYTIPPLVRASTVSTYGRGGYGVFPEGAKYSIPTLVEYKDGKIIPYFAESFKGDVNIEKNGDSSYTITYSDEEYPVNIYLY